MLIRLFNISVSIVYARILSVSASADKLEEQFGLDKDSLKLSFLLIGAKNILKRFKLCEL